MRSLIKVIVIILVISSCNSNHDFYPEKHHTLSQGQYEEYMKKLEIAYEKKIHSETAIQLANLKADKKMVFQELNKGIINNENCCPWIIETYHLFKEHNFQKNIVKIDTVAYTNSFNLCLKQMGEERYESYKPDKKENFEFENNIDSSKANLALIEELDQILAADQSIRNLMHSKKMSKKQNDSLLVEREKLDSINLIKVESIIKEYGFPSVEEIGNNHMATIWLVLQHQSDLSIRKKYWPFIKANSTESGIEAYLKKTKDIELAMEK